MIDTRAFPPQEASRLRRIRRYAVPRWMIERAAERRLAGDWRGACAAANMDVAFDLAEVADEHGREVAAALEDDLRHLAPDLLRWHAPRVGRGRTTLTPDQVLILSADPGDPRRTLHVTTPRLLVHGPQRLTLRFGAVTDLWPYLNTDLPYLTVWHNIAHRWDAARHLWDVRHTDELRERCGGDARRAPFLEPDGTPRRAGLLPSAAPGRDDPAAHAEWAVLLHESGDARAAMAAAGIAVDEEGVDLEEYLGGGVVETVDVLARLPLAPARLADEVRRLSERGHGDEYWIPATQHVAVVLRRTGEGLGVELVGRDDLDESLPALPDASWRMPPDVDALRHGVVPAEELHPLVRGALAPARAFTGPGGPPGPGRPGPARIRCRGEWHAVAFRDGALSMPHDEGERRREQALLALGGTVGGCEAAERAWREGGRLPKALDAQRRELLARIQHGDTPGVLALLDAGADPRVRDARGRTLLHALPQLDWEALLPRLLPVLDLEARDGAGRTPLHVVVFEDGSPALVRALLDAGARIDAQDEDEITVARVIGWRRTDLDFLTKRIEEEHPDLDW
ncbi:ankyrin repeat domain-containing protein [Actinomadura verrucosospora]|uniref:ankyrin repeat domain-containing protein n=1 Tax=Actinomadura verrucosospora TaxID=46165 RepID=UPI001C205D81|nr:ankyrin repeat domain-containing protein [Actinomadura verrucosospora]